MKRVLIVDDDEVIRGVMRVIVESEGYRFLEAPDGRSAVRVVQQETPDAIILDLTMPGMGGIETLQEVKRLNPWVPVIILTAHGDIPIAVTALKIGAYDFLTKPPEFSNLLGLIKQATGISGNCRLTRRERETIEWIKEGKSNADIAALMGLSENTVRTHLKNVFTKLGVFSKAQAVSAAFERGIFQTKSQQF